MNFGSFYEEAMDIYRLKIPFEAIYTSVFLIRSPSGTILVDCATTSQDVDTYIVPALEKMGYQLSDIRMLVLTHLHRDHMGGLERILELASEIEVVKETRLLFAGIFTYPLAGHTEDCIGVLDTRSNTLISGDGLQGAGVDNYRCYAASQSAYFETIDRIKNDKRIENILFSHPYEPWYRDCMRGRDEVEECLLECVTWIKGEKNESNTCQ